MSHEIEALDRPMLRKTIAPKWSYFPERRWSEFPEPTRRILGVVGNKYRPIQNVKAFEVADAIVEEGGARFETAGSLNNGRRVWLLAKLPEAMRVVDDVIDKYLLLSTSHDGSQALEIRTTPIRVVCSNTLSVAVRGAKQRVSIRHTENHESQMRQAVAILRDAEAYFRSTGELLHKLATTRITDRFTDAFLLAMMPNPAKGANTTRAEKSRAEVKALYNGRQYGASMQAVRGTAYGLLNAMTQYIDHHRTTRSSNGRSAAESRFDATMFGSGASLRQQATDLILHAVDQGFTEAVTPADALLSQIAMN